MKYLKYFESIDSDKRAFIKWEQSLKDHEKMHIKFYFKIFLIFSSLSKDFKSFLSFMYLPTSFGLKLNRNNESKTDITMIGEDIITMILSCI